MHELGRTRSAANSDVLWKIQQLTPCRFVLSTTPQNFMPILLFKLRDEPEDWIKVCISFLRENGSSLSSSFFINGLSNFITWRPSPQGPPWRRPPPARTSMVQTSTSDLHDIDLHGRGPPWPRPSPLRTSMVQTTMMRTSIARTSIERISIMWIFTAWTSSAGGLTVVLLVPTSS